MSSIQILPPTDLPQEVARLLDEVLWDRSEPTRVAVNRDRTQSVAVEKLDGHPGYVVRSAYETTWFSDEDQAEKHYAYLIAGTGLSEDNL